MTNPTTVDQIADRVEHLLLRHEELQKTNALLHQQVLALSHERDLLKSKLAAARSRVDALIERLPHRLGQLLKKLDQALHKDGQLI
jgi:cell division protein ZapB